MTATPEQSPWSRPFNSPLEAGLRALAVLLEAYPNAFDGSRLLYFDYLLVHSGDVPNGPESLHPATPLRTGELLVRRGLVEQGVRLMASRGLIEHQFDPRGISFRASELAAAFMDNLEAAYTQRLRTIAEWVVSSFGDYSEERLGTFIREHLDHWGAEFEAESIVREVLEWQ